MRETPLTTVSGTSSPQVASSRYHKTRLKRPKSPQPFRSGSVIIQRTPVSEFRRLASAEIYDDSPTSSFHAKLTTRFGKSWKPRTNSAARACKEKVLESLRDDFVQSFRARGVVPNTKITEEEEELFRHCYNLLLVRQNDQGLSSKLLVKYLLECKIFPCMKEAASFCRSLPGRRGITISAEVLIASANCVEFHQKGRSHRFIKLLPSSELIKRTAGL